jgi:hypothetical protein
MRPPSGCAPCLSFPSRCSWRAPDAKPKSPRTAPIAVGWWPPTRGRPRRRHRACRAGSLRSPCPVTNRRLPPRTPGEIVCRTGGRGPRHASGGWAAYSFSAKDLDIKDALALFARSNELNIISDPDVTGTVSVEFRNLPIEKSMEAILGSFGYYAEASGGLIRVHSQRTEFFTVDYLRLIRSGNGSSSANISSSSSEGSGGGGAERAAERVVVTAGGRAAAAIPPAFPSASPTAWTFGRRSRLS